METGDVHLEDVQLDTMPGSNPSIASTSAPVARPGTQAWSASALSSNGLGIPVEVDLASEFRYRDPLVTENSLFIAVSQSGETADTLAALKEAKRRGARF